MLTSPFPDRPWQKVATDLFQHNGKDYAIVVHYFSRFFEIGLLTEVITRLKSFFARHGIPEIVASDNGPQYTAAPFAKFAEEWGFTHLTSSPKYPQSNGEAERAVKTAKSLLKKADDPYLSLLSYRSTSIHNGYGPAELLMGRKLRPTLPTHAEKLQPKLPDFESLHRKEHSYKLRQAENYDKAHNASKLSELNSGDVVWIPDKRSPETVLKKSNEPRSYIVETDNAVLRRNRRHLIPDPNGGGEGDEADVEGDTIVAGSDRNSITANSQVNSSGTHLTTRSGRVVVPPKRFINEHKM